MGKLIIYITLYFFDVIDVHDVIILNKMELHLQVHEQIENSYWIKFYYKSVSKNQWTPDFSDKKISKNGQDVVIFDHHPKTPIFYLFLKFSWPEKNSKKREIWNLEKMVYFEKYECFPQK